MASHRVQQLPLRRPATAVRERSDTDPDDRFHRGRRVRPPSRYNKPPPRTRSPSQSPPSTEQDETASRNDENTPESRSPSPAPAKYRPIVTVDWRSELCRFLHLSNQITDNEIFEALAETEGKLRDAERLKYQYAVDPGPPRSQVIHRIDCQHEETSMIYLDEPWPVESGPYHAHLRGSRPVANLELYLERNKNISFLVFREYRCCHRSIRWQSMIDTNQSTTTDLSLFFSGEYIDLNSPDARLALETLSELALAGIHHPHFDDNDGTAKSISYPYLWWFHRRHEIALSKSAMDPTLQQHVEVLQTYMEDRLQPEWTAVDDLTAKGKITLDLLRYIYVPNDIIISQTRGKNVSQLTASTAIDWLSIDTVIKDSKYLRAVILVEVWNFDGSFHKAVNRWPLDYAPVDSWSESFDITSLSVYPARFAKNSVVEGLRGRGKMFWACRHRKYVSYVKEVYDAANPLNGSRFMVDLETYKKMHPTPQPPQPQQAPRKSSNQKEIPPLDLMSDIPPADDTFLMCLPSTMKGFDMDSKTWRTLEVTFMQDVVWNREAFEDLVIEPKTKDLVKAVVMNRLTSDENTDLIHGKGNGLFILLHGGPGTGKTLTAESVAEIAEKPLYKVTCGDVGTKPDEVEEYLKVVTLLGKTWDCVVLLDEADVFLEQRSLSNLKRNALVSVFLRVLEYYDGIMILTTNRVGTFDEAFKSRIQLNLRYNNLDEEKRFKIWTNSIRRLELKLKTQDKKPYDYGIDSDSIQSQLRSLAAENLNGREIRNAISTARQLSLFKREALHYDHLSSVISEAQNFEKYLVKLHQGHSADEIQHDLEAR
ncbi:ATPase [Colletotrichum higginsianum]|uniref:ATPase n=1 Tax=Colletotrichum higginsianum (strain IMI 349063) TaxID=759273 RepID=H1V8D0_COLHI|nr:ATPase [Colletotrichum higginsianum]